MSQDFDICGKCFVITRYHICDRKDCPRKPKPAFPDINDLPIPRHPKEAPR